MTPKNDAPLSTFRWEKAANHLANGVKLLKNGHLFPKNKHDKLCSKTQTNVRKLRGDFLFRVSLYD